MTTQSAPLPYGQRGGSWQYKQLIDGAPGLAVLSETLADLTKEGHPIVTCTADLKYSNGLARYEERYPDRFFQFGIAEHNMVSAAAGMATTGLKPYAATFASYLALLCCEQVRTDIAYTALPVRLIGHHSGIGLGFYGSSHHATEDIAIMRSIAEITVVAPADGATLDAALRATVDHDEPIYFRLGRGEEPDVYGMGEVDFQLGKAIRHGEGEDLTVFATGSTVHPALEAAELLRADGHSVGVVDLHTLKPLDRAEVLAAAARSRHLMTVEEHNLYGGLGGAVAEVLADEGAGVPLYRHGIPDEYSLIGTPTSLYKHYEIDAEGIARRAEVLLDA